jgi:hypothetical protein
MAAAGACKALSELRSCNFKYADCKYKTSNIAELLGADLSGIAWSQHYNKCKRFRQILQEFAQSLEVDFLSSMAFSRFSTPYSTQLYGISPPDAQCGDIVAVAEGFPFPLLLRTRSPLPGAAQTFEIVNICYVHGMMNGEAYRDDGLPTADLVIR